MPYADPVKARENQVLRSRRYVERHREEINRRRRDHRAAHPEILAAENERRAEVKHEWAERDWQRNPEKYRERANAYNRENPEKARAHWTIRNAVRSGRLVAPDHCERCGVECRPDAHHDDYGAPLEVEWLCVRCHRRHHSENWGTEDE